MTIIHRKTPEIFLDKNEKQEKSECKFSSISRRPQRNAHLQSVRAAGEEDETIYIRSSMEGRRSSVEEEARRRRKRRTINKVVRALDTIGA